MRKVDFNRGWLVKKAGESQGIQVNLPDDAMIYEERSKDAAPAGACGYFHEGKYIYSKKFTAPKDWWDDTIIVEFEAVYKNASVLLNGEKIYERPYGYTNFFVNLTGKIRFGQENELTVIADNSKAPNSRWYSGSGIYREVHMYVGPQRSIAPEGIKVTYCGDDVIEVETAVMNGGETPALDQPIRIQIIDPVTGSVVTSIRSSAWKKEELVIPMAKHWSPENPYLYTCKVITSDGDSAEVNFGMREITWNGKGLFIDGQETLLRGGCIHHDNGILGACSFADAEERRVRIMKECGFNAIRSAHNPMSKAMLDACDRLGMLVMDENFDMWMIHKNPYDYGKDDFSGWWREDTRAMIDKDYNHPSVIMYSIGNEISDLGLEDGQELCGKMADFVRRHDSTRPVTMGINLMLAGLTASGKGLYKNDEEDEKTSEDEEAMDSPEENGKKENKISKKNKKTKKKSTGSQTMDSMPTSSFFNLMMNKMGDMMELATITPSANKVVKNVCENLDIPGYNYAGARYKNEAKKYPDRPFVGSETLPKSLYRNWQMVKEMPNLIGDFMWTAWDYLGEAGIGTVRYSNPKTKKDVDENLIISGGAGVIDICGKARPETGWNKIIWGLQEKPVIAVDPLTHADDFKGISMWRDTDAVESWSWEGYEGKQTDVVVYTPEGSVLLVVNGKKIGKTAVTDGKAIFHKVTYEPGYIGAIAFDKDGNKAGKTKLTTSFGDTHITLNPEKTRLHANGQDLCFLNIDLTGEKGITKSSCDQKLTVTVEGCGTLQAFGSARPNMGENFYSSTHTTYYGKALAVIRAGYEKGTIRVTVSGVGLETQTITLQVK